MLQKKNNQFSCIIVKYLNTYNLFDDNDHYCIYFQD